MSADKPRALLAEQVTAVINAVMPDATVMEMPSVIGDDGVSVSAFDENDTRPAVEIASALAGRLRAEGWEVAESSEGETEGLHAAKAGIGGGVFGVQTAVISFAGMADQGHHG